MGFNLRQSTKSERREIEKKYLVVDLLRKYEIKRKTRKKKFQRGKKKKIEKEKEKKERK
jgi:hypothetical protein